MMKINFRTVEYYRENICCKVGAVSKKDLLDKIKGTDFMDYVQHIEKNMQRLLHESKAKAVVEMLAIHF